MEITFENHTPSALVLFSVDVDLFSFDSMSKRERREGVVRPGGTYSFYVPGVPSELRIKDFNTEARPHGNGRRKPCPTLLFRCLADIGSLGADSGDPSLDSLGDELRSVIGPDVTGTAAQDEQIGQNVDDIDCF